MVAIHPQAGTFPRPTGERDVIEVRDLTRGFDEHVALRGISFRVPEGAVWGFLGPNGAGKTTTLRILATVLRPESGTAAVAGFDAVREPNEVRRRLGYLPERPPLDLRLTVLEFLRFCCHARGVPRRAVRQRIERWSERCGLQRVRGRLIGNLSHGYRQRVGLAQALVHEPAVLILDEPTSGLDPGQAIEIRRLIAGLGGDRTILLSTHLLPDVAASCEAAIVVHEGRIAAEGPIERFEAEGGLERAFLRVTSAGAAT